LATAILSKREDNNASESIIGYVGKIILNLQALELALRLFLYDTVGPIDPSFGFSKLSVGDRVPITPLTNYDSLGTLIKKVNVQLKILRKNEQIDASLVDLRDSIAHGRTLSASPYGIPRLFKFSSQRKDFVKVQTSMDLTPKWLSDQVKHTLNEIHKIVRISQGLGFSSFPTK
jgi:hypothetical protein